MAYEFKKLGDVEIVETPMDTANVLIEEDGVIKKVAKDEVGGVKVASAAEVGQTIVVKAVNENGNPIEWECADFPEGVKSWNDLEDKPFGEEEVETIIVEECSVEFTNRHQYLFTGTDIHSNFVLGTTLRVTWDNVEYDCEVKYRTDVATQFGDAAIGGEEGGTGEPFFFTVSHSAGTVRGHIKEEDVGIHTLKISRINTEVKQLDPKYIKDMYWEEEPKEVVFVPETILEGFTVMQGPLYAVQNAFSFNPKLNTTYTVTWDGVSYDLQLKDFGGLGCLGNENYVDTNVGGDIPFALIFDDDIFVVTESTAASHSISIVEIESVIHYLDPKYIKDMYHEYMAPNNDIVIEEQTISTDSDYSYVDVGIDSFLVEGASYIVNWNGTEYTCTARYDSRGSLYIGNQEVGIEVDDWEFPETIESNEPFFFSTYEEENAWVLFVQTAGEYSISIVGTGEKLTPYKIDMKYMPDDVKYGMQNLWENMDDLQNQVSSEKLLLNKNADIAMPQVGLWRSIAYGNGKFVAVDQGEGVIAYSANGINWTLAVTPSDINWYSVVYGDGKFVAVGYNSSSSTSYAAHSVDGIVWVTYTMSINLKPNYVTYVIIKYANGTDNSKYIALPYQGNAALYSIDGIDWISTTMPVEAQWKSIAYGSDNVGNFGMVAVGMTTTAGSTNTLAHSRDGITWTKQTMSEKATWHSVACGKRTFVAVGRGTIVYATNFLEPVWRVANLPSSATSSTNWTSVTYGNGKFVAISSEQVIYSTDGINWTSTTMPSVNEWYSVAYCGDKFVVGSGYSRYDKKVAYSIDGINWIGTCAQLQQNGDDVTNTVKEALGIAEVTASDSVIISSPNGTRFKITVDDSGTITATAI